MKNDKKSKKSFIVKNVDGVEIRKFVREAIIPEILEAIKDHDFRDDLKEALGLHE